MFLNKRFFGQYEEGDYEAPAAVYSVEEHGQAERAAAITEAGNSFNPGTSVYSGILPVLTNIVSGAAPIIASYLNLQSVKSQASAISGMTPTQQAAYLAATAPKVVTPVQAGFALPSNWPILGIIAIGAFLVLRGRKSSVPVKTRRVRRRR